MTQNISVLPDDGTATLFTVSERLGMHFWIDEDAVFMSAPSYATGGGWIWTMQLQLKIGNHSQS